jgi:glycosyltransferase 2 family protein
MRAVLLRVTIVVAVLGLVSWFAGERLFDGMSTLQSVLSIENAPVFAMVTVGFALSSLLLGAAWIVLLEALSPQDRRNRRALLTAFSYAWLGRYVPGTLPFFAGKVYLGKELGYRTRPLLVTTAVQNMLELMVSATIGCTFIALARGMDADGRLFAAAAAIPAVAFLALHPRLLCYVTNAAMRLLRRPPVERSDLPGVRTLVLASGFVAANQVMNGMLLLVLVSVVAGVSPADALLVIGAFSLAGALGLLIVLAPAGLGIRDGALATLLAVRFTVEAAAVATVLVRAITVVSDVLLASVALLFDRLSGQRIAIRVIAGQRHRKHPAPAIATEKGAA